MKLLRQVFVVQLCFLVFACGDHKIPGEPSHRTSNGSNTLQGSVPIDPNEKNMLAEIERQNSICRGTPDSGKACDVRDALLSDAEKSNWCWGPTAEIGANKHWIRCTDDPDYVPKRVWFAHDINHANCVKSMSPADRIRLFQEQGRIPRVHDKPYGVVEVEVDLDSSRSEVWTYYPDQSVCINSLPRSKKIDSKYE